MIEAVKAQARQRMEKTVEDLMRELVSIRTGRASIHILDGIMVDYYGTPTPLNQLATLHAPDPALVTVQPWDISQLSAIERAIIATNLGIMPSNDGKIIRLPIPALTHERRQELAKQVHKITEDHRTAIRNIRRDVNDRLKKALKNKELSEDEEHRALAEIQTMTDSHIAKIEELAKAKEQEILEV